MNTEKESRAREQTDRDEESVQCCRGFDIGDGNYSGCAVGAGMDPALYGNDVCPACNNSGLAPR